MIPLLFIVCLFIVNNKLFFLKNHTFFIENLHTINNVSFPEFLPVPVLSDDGS